MRDNVPRGMAVLIDRFRAVVPVLVRLALVALPLILAACNQNNGGGGGGGGPSY